MSEPSMDPRDYLTLPAFAETGYVVLDSYDQAADPAEWLDIEYVDWKSSGDTRFAPLGSGSKPTSPRRPG